MTILNNYLLFLIKRCQNLENICFNPTSWGGAFKWQFQHFFGQIESKKIDFSYKPMRMPIIAFWGLEMVKKGVSIAFLLLAVTKSGS